VQPAVDDGLGGLLGGLVVALHHQVATDADLARLAARQDFVGVVHDLDADQRIGSADRGQALVRRELAGDEVSPGVRNEIDVGASVWP